MLNQGAAKNASIVESVQNKKDNAINYHAVREAAGVGFLQVMKEDAQTNLANLLSKVLPNEQCCKLLNWVLYNL
jgi:hypothetical protein